MRKKIAAGNWKMNLTLQQGNELVKDVLQNGKPTDVEVIFCVPYLYLKDLNELVREANGFYIAAQNLHEKEKGAYTGEISAIMLKHLRIRYCILGHSERRQYYNDSDAILKEKLNIAYQNDITPIFCCGESLEIRKSGKHIEYVINQLKNTLFYYPDKISGTIIAYEPIWAIGTGETASPEQAEEMHAAIRSELSKKFGENIAENVSILYGGSVTPANAADLFSCANVDGGLVGGASLKAEDFTRIINSF